ncbi:MAG: type II toxin-antitoxin system RelE/ParE family toxin [Isosphaeraceae bacterium]
MKVVWTRNATRELRSIHDYIAQNSQQYAQGVVDRITRRTRLLAQFPHLGPRVPEYDDEAIREVLEHPYRVIYRIHKGRIQILSIVHGARPLPPEAPGNPR